MSEKSTAAKTDVKPSLNSDKSGLLQRKCDCGNAAGLTGKCSGCQQHKLTVQRKEKNGGDVGSVPAIVHEFNADQMAGINSSLRRMPIIQAKLTISASNDPLEQEADRVADLVMSASPSSVVNSAPPRIQRSTRQATGQADMVAPASVDRVLSSSGSPLESGLRQDMEQRFGHDFSRVRVHTGGEAARSARDVNASAYTVGHNVVFGAGQFIPETQGGQRLIAHELTHVVQQDTALTHVLLQREPDDKPEELTQIGMMVSISGLIFQVPKGIIYKPGRKSPQLLAIVLQRLLGSQYKPGLEQETEVELSKRKFIRYGGFQDGNLAKGGEPIEQITFLLLPTLVLISFLKAKQLQVQLTSQQEDLLNLGTANLGLWEDFVRTVRENGNSLPAWYTRDIFDREIARHGKLLREYADLLERYQKGDDTATAFGLVAIDNVINALYEPAMVLEAIRLDITLAANEETIGIYDALWQLPQQNKKGETPKITSPPTKLRSIATAVLFLGYMRTQPALMRNAGINTADRLELVKRYARYTQQMFLRAVKEGDEEIRDRPATANYPAFPSTLSANPPLRSLLFDTSIGTDHSFSMEVQFPSVYEALGNYAFNWELVRIPDNKIGEPVDVSKLQGDKVTTSEVAAVRFNRDTAYAEADIQRVLGDMRTDIGPVGIGATELVVANAILRYVGTGIRLGVEILTIPSNQKKIVFPSPGLYLIRAAMSQVREGNEEVVRSPSVAYYPILARNPDEIAVGGVKSAITGREKTEKRIKELEAILGTSNLAPKDRKQYEEELEALRIAIGPLGKRLEKRSEDITKQIAAIKSGTESGDLETTTKELENINKIINLRTKRKIGEAKPLTASFVSDLGQTIPLMLEVVDRSPAKPGNARVYISDVTTPKSGDETGYGRTIDDAIVDGVKRLLESTQGYGRGRVSLVIGDTVHTIRIEASLSNLLVESIENVGTVLSVAAIAAAPFTGGASLSILIPVGVVGAIPSAYRVVQRIESGTFEMDLENAVEIVNIAGSLIGLSRVGATSLRMMRIGKALLVVGFGVDAAGGILMGVQLITQIEALSKLPEG